MHRILMQTVSACVSLLVLASADRAFADATGTIDGSAVSGDLSVG